MMQVDDLGFCPSFNCYYSDTPASTAATRVSTEEQAARFRHVDEEEFEFSLVRGDDDVSANGITSTSGGFPCPNQHEVDRIADASSSMENLFINKRKESPSSSSSEADDSESKVEPSGVFCVWRYSGSSSSHLSKCKKSSSTGSGSKRWRIRDLLRRSNSEGKEPMVLVSHKIPSQKRNSGDVSIVARKSKPSVHELFYVPQRQNVKRKSYLPYRQGLVAFFNINGKE